MLPSILNLKMFMKNLYDEGQSHRYVPVIIVMETRKSIKGAAK